MTLRICARPRGPLAVENAEGLELYAPDGTRVDVSHLKRVLLCRCGHTSCAPLCDGSHNRTTFEAPAPQDQDRGLNSEEG